MFKNNNLFITSNDFAEFANVVYSNREKYGKQNFNKDKEVIEISNNPDFEYIIYKKLSFELKDNDVIFCHTNQINNLFYHLKRVKKIKNITLITHQTDKLISKKDFNKKPECIEKWFSVNVGYNHPNLVPIPIGIASDFSLKNLNSSDFSKFKENNFHKKDINLYINFRVNTNFKERKDIHNRFKNEPWVISNSPDLDKITYLNNLSRASFVLCPWGNGVDTHRFWETLYAGSIPVTKKHPTYKPSEGLPALFVNDYKEINYDLLESFMSNLDLNDYNFEKLTKEYWHKEIKKEYIHKNNEIIYEKKYETLFFKLIRSVKKIYNSKIKKFTTYANKINKKLRF